MKKIEFKSIVSYEKDGYMYYKTQFLVDGELKQTNQMLPMAEFLSDKEYIDYVIEKLKE